jgi:membrane associated rhomboid family serine protease
MEIMASSLRRPWPASFPVPLGSGLLALASVAGFWVAAGFPGALRALALVPADLAQRPWSAVSYAILDPTPYVLILNLAVLTLVGPRLEKRVGALRLLGYWAGGIGLGLAIAALRPSALMSGAGPAMFGLLVGYARHCAGEPLVPRFGGRMGQWQVAVLAAAVLLPPASEFPSVAIPFLLGLPLLGLLLLNRPAKTNAGRRVEAPNSHFNPVGMSRGPVETPWDAIDLGSLHEVNREVVERLLDRARVLGPDHLTPGERELLDRMAYTARMAAELRFGVSR